MLQVWRDNGDIGRVTVVYVHMLVRMYNVREWRDIVLYYKEMKLKEIHKQNKWVYYNHKKKTNQPTDQQTDMRDQSFTFNNREIHNQNKWVYYHHKKKTA